MSINKIHLLDELERIIRDESFSDNPRKTKIDKSFIKKEKDVEKKINKNCPYLVLAYDVSDILLNKVLNSINLEEHVNYKYVDISLPIFNAKNIKTLVTNSTAEVLLIIGKKSASKVFNRDIDIEKARLKEFKYCNKKGIVISDFDIDNKKKKIELWNDLKFFSNWQNLGFKK